MAERILIKPSILKGEVNSITSKTYGHRMIILSALSKDESTLIIGEYNEDLCATLNCIKNLGANYQIDKDELRVLPIELSPKEVSLNCKESGSTLRFIIPVATALYDRTFISGENSLKKRPIKPLLEALSKSGVKFSSTSLPIKTEGKFEGGEIELPGNISSQFVTGILLASTLIDRDTEITLTSPLESKAYVDVTLEVLKDYGVKVIELENGYYVEKNQRPMAPKVQRVQGDWSNGAALLVAGAMEGDVTIRGLKLDSSQGDRVILDILKSFGADLKIDNSIQVKSLFKKPIEMDINECPDLLPVLAILSCSTKGVSKFFNGRRLRLKESDRLKNSMDLINRLGGKAMVLEDDLIVHGMGSLNGGVVSSYNDHRMVMAATIASTISQGEIVIDGYRAIDKSYPKFFEDFKTLGGKCIELDNW
ncbi:3-phosphoshikimate 1-carboxyvinyltransferase [Lagierella sp.]|uniref:3-phosphoshikimate 1-carboxyvinyltransferase n=1 Tax=Lagierella sp. TaxID=2849657 RepID=UPI0026154413|nr:3-phosphoshikimate 1-carboxyvinyltransferase [Lagierella sp.]